MKNILIKLYVISPFLSVAVFLSIFPSFGFFFPFYLFFSFTFHPSPFCPTCSYFLLTFLSPSPFIFFHFSLFMSFPFCFLFLFLPILTYSSLFFIIINSVFTFHFRFFSAAKKQQALNTDDISAFCCTHGILKNLCYLCRGDPDQPTYKMGKVWRERVSYKKPGEMIWKQEPCVEKVS